MVRQVIDVDQSSHERATKCTAVIQLQDLPPNSKQLAGTHAGELALDTR